MSSFNKAAVAVLTAGILSASLFAGSTATQTVGIAVSAINELAVTGTPALTVSTATAGAAPDSVTATATYAITTNETNRKITAAIEEVLPPGVTLQANLAAPTGATSTGTVTLGTTAQDVVTGISTLNESGKNITYTLAATSAAGTVASTSRIVTYTITAGTVQP